MAYGSTMTSLTTRTEERSVAPVLVAQRLGTAVECAPQRSCETDVIEEEEEWREQIDPVGRGMNLMQFVVG